MVARTIPLAPFLVGRGKKIKSLGDTPRPPAVGGALCTPAREKKEVYGGTSSMPPARGAVPLWTPLRCLVRLTT